MEHSGLFFRSLVARHFNRKWSANAKRHNFYDYLAECEIGVSEREFTRLVDWSVGRSLGRKLDLTKRKMSSNGSANMKHSEAMSDEIITAMSTACDASILLFELFIKKKPRKHLLS